MTACSTVTESVCRQPHRKVITNKITCSFTVDRDIYNAYKSIVVKGGENVKGNLIRYMLNVINYETPNADTISAIKEVEELKKTQTKKPMHHLASF